VAAPVAREGGIPPWSCGLPAPTRSPALPTNLRKKFLAVGDDRIPDRPSIVYDGHGLILSVATEGIRQVAGGAPVPYHRCPAGLPVIGTGPMPSCADRIPSLDALRDAHAALWGFYDRSRTSDGDPAVQEDELLVYVGRVVEALAPILPLIDSLSGWPHRTGRALRQAAKAFDQIIAGWGWEGLAVPEPDRSAEAERRRSRYREEVIRPLLQAALTIQEAATGLDLPRYVDGYAEQARELGLSALPDAEKAREICPVLYRKRYEALQFSDEYPSLGDLGRFEFEKAINIIHADLKAADPGRPLRRWRPEEPDAAPSKEEAPPLADRCLESIRLYRVTLQEVWDRLAYREQHGRSCDRPWPAHHQAAERLQRDMREALPSVLARFGDGPAAGAVRWWAEAFEPQPFPCGEGIPEREFWLARKTIDARIASAEGALKGLADLGHPLAKVAMRVIHSADDRPNPPVFAEAVKEAESDSVSDLSEDSRASAIFTEMAINRERITVTEIARRLGVPRTQMYERDRFPHFNTLHDSYKAGKAQIRRGRKDRHGNVEAEIEDPNPECLDD
jgi:hypothetical protein